MTDVCADESVTPKNVRISLRWENANHWRTETLALHTELMGWQPYISSEMSRTKCTNSFVL